ncbi:hypothetical protein LP52_19395 [Streptomonospora alba]|uniref:Uncharacterized protein n=1 Tax=Streptomonospora alba TaxID=183763 RepID=A0A0C2G269_9ACTN|nr:hypothetical protein LP52_19395 [Streptomonospora alba]
MSADFLSNSVGLGAALPSGSGCGRRPRPQSEPTEARTGRRPGCTGPRRACRSRAHHHSITAVLTTLCQTPRQCHIGRVVRVRCVRTACLDTACAVDVRRR